MRQQPISNERPDDADDKVAYQTVAAAPHDVAGEPPGDNADNNDDEETFVRQVHGRSSVFAKSLSAGNPPNDPRCPPPARGPAGRLTPCWR